MIVNESQIILTWIHWEAAPSHLLPPIWDDFKGFKVTVTPKSGNVIRISAERKQILCSNLWNICDIFFTMAIAKSTGVEVIDWVNCGPLRWNLSTCSWPQWNAAYLRVIKTLCSVEDGHTKEQVEEDPFLIIWISLWSSVNWVAGSFRCGL